MCVIGAAINGQLLLGLSARVVEGSKMALDPWSYAEKTRNEFAEQVALFMWANMTANFGPNIASDPHSYNVAGFAKTQFDGKGGLGFIRYSEPLPVLKRMFAIKNAGHGDAIRGAMSKAEGVKPGVPDIMLPVQARISVYNAYYCGLFVELKRLKSQRGAAGSTSQVQDDWREYLTQAGYAVEVCHGWEAARDAILRYLGKADTWNDTLPGELFSRSC